MALWTLSGITQVSQYQNQSGFYWSKRQWVAVASAGLHLVCICRAFCIHSIHYTWTCDVIECKAVFDKIVLLMSIKQLHNALQRIDHNHITVSWNILLNSRWPLLPSRILAKKLQNQCSVLQILLCVSKITALTKLQMGFEQTWEEWGMKTRKNWLDTGVSPCPEDA